MRSFIAGLCVIAVRFLTCVACYVIHDLSTLQIVISVKSILDHCKLLILLCRKRNVHRSPVRKQFEREECFERYSSSRLQHGSSISIKKL